MNNRLRHIASIISPYSRGEKAVLSSLTILKRQQRVAPIPELFAAIARLAPGLKVKSQIRAGRTIYFPAYLNAKSAVYHAVRWSLAKEGFSPKITLAQRFSTNLLDAAKKTGIAYKYKKDLNVSVVQSRVHYRPRRFRFRFKRLRKHKLLSKRKLRLRYNRLYLKKRTAIFQLIYLTDKRPAELFSISSKTKKRRERLKKKLEEKRKRAELAAIRLIEKYKTDIKGSRYKLYQDYLPKVPSRPRLLLNPKTKPKRKISLNQKKTVL